MYARPQGSARFSFLNSIGSGAGSRAAENGWQREVHHSDLKPERVRLRDPIARGPSVPRQQESDMTNELNISELDLVSGGDLKEVHFRPDYKEPTVLFDDGIN